jgi:hypothetical protein
VGGVELHVTDGAHTGEAGGQRGGRVGDARITAAARRQQGGVCGRTAAAQWQQ